MSVSCSQACVTWRWLAPREFDAVDARDPDIDLLLIATAVDGDGLAAAVLREADRACERHRPHLRALERIAAPYLALGVVLEAEQVVVVERPPERVILHASHGPAVLQRAGVLPFRGGGGRVVDEVDAVLDGEHPLVALLLRLGDEEEAPPTDAVSRHRVDLEAQWSLVARHDRGVAEMDDGLGLGVVRRHEPVERRGVEAQRSGASSS